METIDITPTPHASVRTIRHIVREVYRLDILNGSTDLSVLLFWKDYEYMLTRMGITPREGTKTLHKEIMRLVVGNPRVKIDQTDPAKLIIIEPATLWSSVVEDLIKFADSIPPDYDEFPLIIGQESLGVLIKNVTQRLGNHGDYITLDETFGEPGNYQLACSLHMGVHESPLILDQGDEF